MYIKDKVSMSVPLFFFYFYNFLISGYMFRKGRMKITVSKVFKISQSSMSPEPISQSYLVELSVSIMYLMYTCNMIQNK